MAHGVLTEASDARLQGTLSIANNANDYAAVGGPSVGNFAFRIENEAGAWQQTPTLSIIWPGSDHTAATGVLVGEDAYAGLIAVFDVDTDLQAERWDLHGYIIEGELPPAPEPYIDG